MKNRKLYKYLVAIVSLWFFVAFTAYARQEEPVDLLQTDSLSSVIDRVLIQTDSLFLPVDTASMPLPVDSLPALPADTVDTQKLKQTNKNTQLDAPVHYTANDSIVFFSTGVAHLYGNNNITYKNINLKADFVRVIMDSSLIYARGTRDSTGTVIGDPVFSESGKEYNSKELSFNLKTKKGYSIQTVTQEGEAFIIGRKTKKMEDDVFCIEDGIYTVCDNHENPHFYMSISKGKIKPGEYVIFGMTHLVVEDVPLPLLLPFGFFPFTKDYSSGILMPSYADELNRGFGLTNGGYYFAINDYVDAEVRGDIYSNGTWAARLNSSYIKKYKFNGSIGLEYREDITGEKDMKDYRKNTNFSVRWSHSQNPKANPNFKFSASVNFATSGYNQSNIDYYSRPEINSQATTSSSINLTKTFPKIPSLNISLSTNISQNNRDSIINLTLPSLQISYSRFYPFKRKKQIGKERWYEKISASYSGNLSNSINTKEYLLFSSSFSKDWKNLMTHSIPISATFNVLKYINVTPSFSYNERWYLQNYKKDWDIERQREIFTDTIYEFSRVYDFNMGVSASTKLYGFYVPLPFVNRIFGNKIDRVRHVMTPSIGFNYRPDFGDDFWGFYGTYTKRVPDKNNPGAYIESEAKYARFQNTPGQGKTGSISYSLGNNIEMKVLNLNDTTGKEPTKKISLIDNLSISGSYNMAADSMNWSPVSTSLRIKLPFMKNYSLSLSTSWDPYMWGLNESRTPVRINKLRTANGKFPRFQGTSTSYSYTFSNDTFSKLFNKKTKSDSDKNNNRNNLSIDSENDEENDDFDTPRAMPSNNKAKPETIDDGYEKVKIPWSISVSYSIRYSENKSLSSFDYDKMEYKFELTHNLNFSGSISLTNNWRISSSTSYDFKAKQFTYTSVNVSRSLHCWSMSGSFVPFGPYKSYSFHIGVNSSMLSDLKYDKRSQYGGSPIIWY